MAIQAVLFDVGNTLVHEQKDWREMEQKGVKLLVETTYGLGVRLHESNFTRTILQIREENFRKSRETNMEITALECFRQALEEEGITDITTELLNRGIEAYFHLQEEASSLLPGVAEALRALSYQGFTLGVVSNATSSLSVRRVLENHGILHWFRTVVVSADVGHRKPKAEIFEIALNNLGVKAPHAVYVGNSVEIDIIGAKAAGIRSILLKSEDTVENTNVRSDFVATSMADVVTIIKQAALGMP